MSRNFATLADSRYLPKLLALLRSVTCHEPAARVYVLALDTLVFDTVSSLYSTDPRVTAVPLRAVETPALLDAKRERSWREYIFTLTAPWVSYALDRFDLPDLAYVDSDIWLMADLAPLYAEVGAASVAIIPHRWTPRHAERLRPNGEFNVGWVYFRNDIAGRSCLEYWQKQCLEWQPGVSGKPGTFSDQKFLDAWPSELGQRCHVVSHRGANLAPWNAEQYTYYWDGARLWIERPMRVDDMGIGHTGYDPVLWYHFHEWASHERRTGYPVPPMVAEHVYTPYEDELVRLGQGLEAGTLAA